MKDEDYWMPMSTPPKPDELSSLVTCITIHFLRETSAWNVSFTDEDIARLLGVIMEYSLDIVENGQLNFKRVMWAISNGLNERDKKFKN